MADNLDDDVSRKPMNIQSENLPTQHKPKKWNQYFLEFVMIFLAVTLGFFAESFRQHIINKGKERQYISGFIRNVRDDTLNLRHVIEFDEWQVKGIDSMLMLSHVNLDIDSHRKSFYHLAFRYFYNSASFKSNDATLQQLKSTGEYRLIERSHVSDSLSKYDADIRNIYGQGEYYDVYFKDIVFRLDELIDMTALGDTSLVKNGKMMNKPFPRLRDGDEKLPTFFNKIFDFRLITNAYAEDYLKPQLERSKRIIAFLKKEYDIQD